MTKASEMVLRLIRPAALDGHDNGQRGGTLGADSACSTVPCCTVLYCAVPCCVVLYHVVLCGTMLCYAFLLLLLCLRVCVCVHVSIQGSNRQRWIVIRVLNSAWLDPGDCWIQDLDDG